jgi:hypothetical protein
MFACMPAPFVAHPSRGGTVGIRPCSPRQCAPRDSLFLRYHRQQPAGPDGHEADPGHPQQKSSFSLSKPDLNERSSNACAQAGGGNSDAFRGFGRLGAPVGEQSGGRLRRRDRGTQGPQRERAEGKIVALPGANGAGKTTLLRAITGLLDVHDGEITTGSVVFDAQPIHEQPPTRIAKPDQGAPSRVTDIEPLSTGPTAKDYTFEKPCYQ